MSWKKSFLEICKIMGILLMNCSGATVGMAGVRGDDVVLMFIGSIMWAIGLVLMINYGHGDLRGRKNVNNS